jgi:hypothetical protein
VTTLPPVPRDSRQRVTVSIAWLYVLSGLGLALVSIGAITAIVWLRPAVDNTPLVVIIIGFASTTLASIIAALKSQEAKHLTREVAYRVDGRLSQLVDETAKLNKAEGRVEGAGLVATAAAVTPPPDTPPVTP